MIISGSIARKKAITITPERLRQLHALIAKYCERVEFTAETVADTRISFESIDELLSYDNFKPRRIKMLEVTGYNQYSRVITTYIGDWKILSIFNYGTTIRCDYQLTSVDAERLFLSAFEDWYKMSIARYWLLGKFSLNGVLLIPGAFFWFLRLVCGGSPLIEIDFGNYTLLAALAILTLGAFVVIKIINYIDVFFFANLFPAVAFLWGEEEGRYKRWDALRINLLWGIVIATLVGLLVNFLFETMKGL